MKKIRVLVVVVVFFAAMPAWSQTTLEVAVGIWNQNVGGELSYTPHAVFPDVVDFDRNLGIDGDTRGMAHLKVGLPSLPGIYLGYTPMEFTGVDVLNRTFEFGDYIFDANQPLETKIELNHFDVGLYYSIPFLNLASLKRLDIELGVNLRTAELDVDVRGSVGGSRVRESQDYTLPIPMLYAAIQVTPVEKLSFETELRGISVKGNYLLSGIGKLKLQGEGPLFIAGGYRYDDILLDEDDLEVDFVVEGFFVESGFEF